MKKFRYCIAALSALLTAGVVYAQTTVPYVTSLGSGDIMQVIKNAQVTAGNQYATLTQLRAWMFGGSSAHSGTPALTSCGTGSPAIVGTDYAMTVTQGTSATGCTVTFSTAFASAPTCVAVNETAPATSTPAYTVSASAITLVTASTSGEIWQIICVAKAGG